MVNVVSALFSFAVFLCAAGQQLEDEYAREKLQPSTEYRQQHKRTMGVPAGQASSWISNHMGSAEARGAMRVWLCCT